MKKSLLLCLLASLGALPALAQTSPAEAGATVAAKPAGDNSDAAAAGTNEADRLMQAYMARRAEWLELRRIALEQAKGARNDTERKQQLARLAEDEKPLLARMGEAARAYRATAKEKSDAQAAAKPRA